MLIGALAKVALLTLVTTHAPVVHVAVAPGDSLSKIAVAQCGGKVNDWTGIYGRNKAVIGRNPNVIHPGMKLAIECSDPQKYLRLALPVAAPVPVAVPQPVQGYAAPAAPAPAPQPAAAYSGAPGSFQACVIARESGGNPDAVNASSGAGGLYQFLQSTWTALGFPGSPVGAPVSEQNAAFAKEYAQSGTSAWASYDGC